MLLGYAIKTRRNILGRGWFIRKFQVLNLICLIKVVSLYNQNIQSYNFTLPISKCYLFLLALQSCLLFPTVEKEKRL